MEADIFACDGDSRKWNGVCGRFSGHKVGGEGVSGTHHGCAYFVKRQENQINSKVYPVHGIQSRAECHVRGDELINAWYDMLVSCDIAHTGPGAVFTPGCQWSVDYVRDCREDSGADKAGENLPLPG